MSTTDIDIEPQSWHGPAIDVVSLGCAQLSHLTPAAQSAIQRAEVIFGCEHHFDEISGLETSADKQLFASPFSTMDQVIREYEHSRIAVLASGDALFFGIGSWLNRSIGNHHLIFHPNISSMQAGFHAIGLPWQSAVVVSLHGRPLSSIRRHLCHQQLIGTFTDNNANPIAMAAELVDQGFGESAIWVCEAMGSEQQQVSEFQAIDLACSKQTFDPLNICIILCIADQPILPSFPGIADHYFSTGSERGFGMISKREVRLVIISLMQPTTGEIAWDIGAGCGSVSVEWARWNHQGQLFAIEQEVERIKHIEINRERFGCLENINIIQGLAPDCCEDLPKPDCIFIGGSNGLATMLEYAWQCLPTAGKLVASAVTETSKKSLLKFMRNKSNIDQVEIQVSKNLPGKTELRTLSPVLLAKCIKH